MALRYLMEKEFLQMSRNAILPEIFIMQPVMLLLVIPFAVNQEVRNLRFCAVDDDRSSFSWRLIYEIDVPGISRLPLCRRIMGVPWSVWKAAVQILSLG